MKVVESEQGPPVLQDPCDDHGFNPCRLGGRAQHTYGGTFPTSYDFRFLSAKRDDFNPFGKK